VICSTKARRREYFSYEEDEENRKLILELIKMMSFLRTKMGVFIKVCHRLKICCQN